MAETGLEHPVQLIALAKASATSALMALQPKPKAKRCIYHAIQLTFVGKGRVSSCEVTLGGRDTEERVSSRSVSSLKQTARTRFWLEKWSGLACKRARASVG